MPKIQAFRGLRYNLAQVGSLSDVVAPPYDVVDALLEAELRSKSPYNFIRLELPNGSSETSAEDRPARGPEEGDPYQQAASLFREWQRRGVLQTEPDPALYVYHQVFDYAGQTITRRGFMARVRLVRFGEGDVYPHEQTHSKAKDDRLRLTRACEANMSQIYGLYPDPENAAQNLLESNIAGTAALEAVDHLGVTHRLWPVTDTQLIGLVSQRLADKPMFVADGHHRYETACNYLDELAESAGGELPEEHPARYVLTMLMSMDDPGLIVLPTHRLFYSESQDQGSRVDCSQFDSRQLRERLSECFDCEPAGSGPEAAQQLWQQIEQMGDQGAFGLYTAKDDEWTLVMANRQTDQRMQTLAADQSEDWRRLGVAVLHRLLIDDLLGMGGHRKPKYVHLVDEVVESIGERSPDGQPTYGLAALVMPSTVDDVRRISLHRERMPAKSTYFYPKLLSGLVVNPLV